MKRHAVGRIGDGVDTLAFGQVGRQIDQSLVYVVEITIDLRGTVGSAGASASRSGRDIKDCH